MKHIDIFPTVLNPGDSHSHEQAFLLRRDVPEVVIIAPGLTASATPGSKQGLASLLMPEGRSLTLGMIQ